MLECIRVWPHTVNEPVQTDDYILEPSRLQRTPALAWVAAHGSVRSPIDILSRNVHCQIREQIDAS